MKTYIHRDEFYTLRVEDVGRSHIHAFGQTWPTSGFIGRMLSQDVGKRVYLRGDIVQVENDEQRVERERL